MKKKDVEKFVKRYDKFKKCNMPVPFFDDERQTLEYVYFDDDNLEVSNTLEYALGNIILDDLYFPFTTRLFCVEEKDGKLIEKEEIGHAHAHSFEEVLRYLYYSPKEFQITKEDEEFYSPQELRFIKHIKNYLMFIEFEGVKAHSKSKARYINKRQKKYGKAIITKLSDKDIKEALLNSFITRKYNEKYSKEMTYNKGERRLLIINEKDEFKYYIELTKVKINLDKEVEEHYFKILEKFN